MTKSSNSTLAVFGGAPVRGADKAWPAWPVFDDAERRAVNEVLESGKWWFGERVKAFERDYAAFHDAQFCITCSTGTAAAEICMQALELKPGDEVIVPPYTFVATASSVARMGGVPVFADLDESWCLSPDAVEAAITPRTRGIVPVHFGGRVADMDRLQALADKHGLFLMEDACHSWGAKWKGKGTGALGDCGVFSFQFSKNITAAEGGAILSDNESLADRCRAHSNCGRMKGAAWYCHDLLGTNARLSEFAAAILSAQLSRLEAQTLLREKNAAILNAALGTMEGITLQSGDERITRRTYHLYCFRIDEKAFGCSRDKFVEAAVAEGLPVCGGYAHPLYKQKCLLNLPGGERYANCCCPVAEDLCYRSGVWFNHPLLLATEADMQDIIAIVRKVRENAAALK